MWNTHKCRICGKSFTVRDPDSYIYKIHRKSVMNWFCGWNHMRQWERDHLPKRAYNSMTLEEKNI